MHVWPFEDWTMTQPKKGRIPVGHAKTHRKLINPKNGAVAKHDCQNDQRFAQAMGENFEWFRAHEDALLRDHPEWVSKHLAISSHTPSKILAIAADRQQAFLEGTQSPEALEIAAQEGMPAGSLVSPRTSIPSWVLTGRKTEKLEIP
jgi:hypothetical protein